MTGCLIFLFVIIAPRLFSLVILLFTNWWSMAFPGWFWPLVGVLFMPLTTLTILGANLNADGLKGGWIFLLVVAIFWDFAQIEANSGDSS